MLVKVMVLHISGSYNSTTEECPMTIVPNRTLPRRCLGFLSQRPKNDGWMDGFKTVSYMELIMTKTSLILKVNPRF